MLAIIIQRIIIYCGGDGNEWRGRQQIWRSLCYDIARFLRCPRRAIPLDWLARESRQYVVRLTVLRGIAGISYLRLGRFGIF